MMAQNYEPCVSLQGWLGAVKLCWSFVAIPLPWLCLRTASLDNETLL